MRCSRPVIEQLAEQTAGAPVCVVLTDDRARLLVRLDTTAAIGRAADDNRFAEGFGYDEGAVGTNGVGTVLESGGSVDVVGAEHFVEPLQPYACVGAPVRDPFTGRIEGVLDVSCRAEYYSPILHSVVASAAARIQDALLHDRDTGQQALFDLYTRVDARSRRAVLAVGTADGAGEHRAADPAGPGRSRRAAGPRAVPHAPRPRRRRPPRPAVGRPGPDARHRGHGRQHGRRAGRGRLGACGRPTARRCPPRCAGSGRCRSRRAPARPGAWRGRRRPRRSGPARRCWSSASPGAAAGGCSPTWTGRCTVRDTSSRSGRPTPIPRAGSGTPARRRWSC